MKKVLITGGNGYIAKSLTKGLNNCNITTITRDNFDLTDYDQTCKFFESTFFDVVIHTAIRGGTRLYPDDDKVVEDNLNMYCNLVANKSNYDKFINLGSGAELYALDTPYGYSKHVIAQSIQQKENHYNIRIYGVFDENELSTRFIKSNILRYINSEQIIVHKNRHMDFFYMPDLVSLMQYYIDVDGDLPKEIDCSYKEHYTLLEIANKINQLDDCKVDIQIVDLELDSQPYIGVCSLINLPYIGINEGIRRVYNNLKTKKK